MEARLCITVEELFKHKDIDVIRAHIKPENLKSIKAFTGAGFRDENCSVTEIENNHCLMFFIHRDDIL